MLRMIPIWQPGVKALRKKRVEIERVYALFEVIVGAFPCHIVRKYEPLETTPAELRILMRLHPEDFTRKQSKYISNLTVSQKDIIKLFMSETTRSDPNNEIVATDLYNAFLEWFSKNKLEDLHMPSQKKFGDELVKLNYPRRKKGVIFYLGISFKNNEFS